MLIFEGPDGSGKTTIASYVSHELGIPLHHFGSPPKSSEELTKRIEFLLYNRDNYIFDRIPLISEPVYSIMRPVNLMMGVEKREEYYNQLREIQPILVYCRPSDEVLLDNSLHNIKEHDTPEHVSLVKANKKMLIDGYDNIINKPYLPPHWVFDYTNQEQDVLITALIKTLNSKGMYRAHLQKGN